MFSQVTFSHVMFSQVKFSQRTFSQVIASHVMFSHVMFPHERPRESDPPLKSRSRNGIGCPWTNFRMSFANESVTRPSAYSFDASMEATALSAFTSPAPRSLLVPKLKGLTVFLSRLLTCDGWSDGLRSSMSATVPETTGAAIEVPDIRMYSGAGA